MTCAFCAVVSGDADGEVVLRTEHFVAFLDIRPVFRGHVLLVPRIHVTTFDELPVELAGEFVTTAQRLERAVESSLEADGSLMIVNNVVSQSVPHLHLHVIPRRRGDGLRLWLGPRHPYESPEDRAEVGDLIRTALAEGPKARTG